MKKLWLALLLGILALAPALAQVVQVAPVPQGAQLIPLTASTTGTTGAISATISGTTGKFTYVCGFVITSAGTTSATSGTATLSGTVSSNMSFIYTFPAAGSQGLLGVAFPGCITSRATNTPITIVAPAGGAGTTVGANLWGYTN